MVKANIGARNHIICGAVLNQASLILKSEIPVKCFQESQEAVLLVGVVMGMWVITAFFDIAAWMVR